MNGNKKQKERKKKRKKDRKKDKKKESRCTQVRAKTGALFLECKCLFHFSNVAPIVQFSSSPRPIGSSVGYGDDSYIAAYGNNPISLALMSHFS